MKTVNPWSGFEKASLADLHALHALVTYRQLSENDLDCLLDWIKGMNTLPAQFWVDVFSTRPVHLTMAMISYADGTPA